jgi:hypothetical protein
MNGRGCGFLSFLSLVLAVTGLPYRVGRAADLVVTPVDRTHRVLLPSRRPSWANPQTDASALPADYPIQHVTIILSRPPELQRAFEQFLDRQQKPGSSDYHRWLTPVEVGEHFGVSTNDIAAVTNWLASEGLQVESVSNSRVLLVFSVRPLQSAKRFARQCIGTWSPASNASQLYRTRASRPRWLR